METATQTRPRRERPKAVRLSDAAAARIHEIMTNADGRFALTSPSTAGQFGPAGNGVALFVQAVVVPPAGKRVESNVAATLAWISTPDILWPWSLTGVQ